MTTRGKSTAGSDAWDEASACAEEAPVSHVRVKDTRLYELLVAHHEDIVVRAYARAAARCRLLQTERSFDAGIAPFAGQLVAALGSAAFRLDLLRQSAERQGRTALRMGFSIPQLVYCYGDVYQVVLGLASAFDVPVAAEELRMLGYCLHEARGSAVAEYERRAAEEVSRQETRELRRLGAELRDPLDTALVAFGGLKPGAEGLGGHAGALLDRSLRRLQDLVGRSLSRVRSQAADALGQPGSRSLDPRCVLPRQISKCNHL